MIKALLAPFLVFLALSGCVNVDPASTVYQYDRKADGSISLFVRMPKDTAGKAFLIEADRGAADSTTADIIDALKLSGEVEIPLESRGFRVFMFDYSEVNNPDVIKEVVDLNKDVAEEQRRGMTDFAGKVMEVIIKTLYPIP